MSKFLKNLRNKTGFTIIELVISIFILSVALVGIFSSLSIMVILTSDIADQLTATYLAQEGMEIVRNIRDTNWLKMNTCSGGECLYTWVDGLTSVGACTNVSTGCQADYASTSMSGNSGDHLYINNSNGFYDYNSSGTPTKFERRIFITNIADTNNQSEDHILKVVVKVSWDKKATILNDFISADSCTDGKNCITTEETLYNWYNYKYQ